jgi:hypothetical protein
MAAYKPLSKLFFADTTADRQANNIKEAQRRLEDEATFRTGIKINTGEIFLAMPRELTVLNEQMLRIERKVSGLWNELPGIARWAYLRSLIVDEVFYTNELEGVYSTRRQVEQALQSVTSKETNAGTRRFREFA